MGRNLQFWSQAFRRAISWGHDRLKPLLLVVSESLFKIQMGMKSKYLVGGLVVVVLLAALIYVGMERGQVYYLTIEEVLAGKARPGQFLRINGHVAEGTVVWDAQAVILRFDLVDQERVHRLPVVYRNVPPAGLAEGGSLMVEGILGEDGTLQATQLLTRCPSRYEEYSE